MDTSELLQTALRAGLVYVFFLVVMRILGKRTVGNITAFDLVVAFIMSDAVGEIIYGDVPVVQGLLAIAVLAGLHLLSSFLGFHFPTLDALFGGQPNVLIRNGEMQPKAMAAERVNEGELRFMLREHNIENMREVKLGTLEVDGHLSVLKRQNGDQKQDDDEPVEHRNVL